MWKKSYFAAQAACLLAAQILMTLPMGIAMVFATGPTERLTSYYSFYHPMVFGYGNWFPLLAAVFSLITLALSLWVGLGHADRKNWGVAIKVLALLSALCSIAGMLLFMTATVIQVIVTVLLAAAAVLEWIWLKKES